MAVPLSMLTSLVASRGVYANQGSAILSESVPNRDTEEPGISISIDFEKFPVSVKESIFTKLKDAEKVSVLKLVSKKMILLAPGTVTS